MTIQEYCSKINILMIEENIPQISDNTDLENIVLEILDNGAGTYLTADALFAQSVRESIMLNNEIITLFTDHSGLMFLNEKVAGNVCFANSSELRPEFRQSFAAIDVLDYLHAFVYSSFYKEFKKIAIPSEVNLFWKLVKTGCGLRKDNK